MLAAMPGGLVPCIEMSISPDVLIGGITRRGVSMAPLGPGLNPPPMPPNLYNICRFLLFNLKYDIQI